MDAALGFMPWASACFQKVVKSGGIGTPVRISTPADWKAEIWLEKSLLRFS